MLEEDALQFPIQDVLTKYDVPLLGVCYGAQYLSHLLGGKVERSSKREYGRAHLNYIEPTNKLFKDVAPNSQVWMSHGDTILQIPENYTIIANTTSIPVAAFKHNKKEIYAIQFHPEVTHSTDGKQILQNFVMDICGCQQDWTPNAL